MKIAAFVDEGGAVTNTYDSCLLCLYDNSSGDWQKCNQTPFQLSPNLGIAGAKAKVRSLFSQVSDCKVCILGSLRGLMAVLIQDFGVRVWISEGPLAEQLNRVACEEARQQPQPEIETSPLAIERVDEDLCSINLIKGMEEFANLNSRQLLIPLLKSVRFRHIEIVCDHVPRWFANELGPLGLKQELIVPNSTPKGMKVLLGRVRK